MWSPRSIALALARLAFVAALFVAIGTVALVMERVAMALTVVAATLVLAWTAVRVPARLLPRCARMVGVVAVLALAPVDLWLSQTGNMVSNSPTPPGATPRPPYVTAPAAVRSSCGVASCRRIRPCSSCA